MILSRSKVYLSCVLMCVTLLSSLVLAQTEAAPAEDAAASRTSASRSVPRTVRFSGVLKAADGSPRTGATTLSFGFYAEPQSGAPLWVETQNVTLDEQGRYSVLLGSATAAGLPMALFANGEARWLGVRAAEEGAMEQPRVQLVSVPYAMASADAQSLGGRPASDFQLTRSAALASGDQAQVVETNGAVSSSANTVNRVAKFTATDTLGDSLIFDNGTNVGIGTTSPTDALHVNGAIRFGPGSFVSGVGKFYYSPQHGTLLTAATGTTNDLGIVATSGNLLLTNPTGTNNLVLLSGGGFGVNTSNITEKLTVNGGIQFGPSSFSAGQPTLYKDAAHGSVLTGSAGSQNDMALVSRVGNLLLTNPTNTNNLVFFSGGNFGLNTFTPTSLLDVNGQIRAAGGIKFGDGTVQTTAATGGGSGDITAVIAGTGLTGGATSGDATLAVNTATIQARITGTCATGQYVRIVNQDGTVTCGTDQTGAGGITYPYNSGNQSSASGAFTVTQTNAVVLTGDPTFASAQSGIPAGVVGVSSSTTNTAAGVAGFANSPNAVAIVGWNGSTTGSEDTDAPGVLGVTENNAGVGVSGEAHAASGFTRGVEGRSSSSNGVGVRGRAEAATGNTTGIVGEVVSPNGVAGYFFAPGGTTSFLVRGGNGGPDVFKVDGNGTVFAAAYKDLNGNPIGGGSGTITGVTAGTGLTGGGTSGSVSLAIDATVARTNANNNFTTSQNVAGGLTATGVVTAAGLVSSGPDGGVLGRDTTNDGGARIGVQGIVDSSGGALGAAGVYGRATSLTGINAGVSGRSDSADGAGVFGRGTSTTGFSAGVRGQSVSTGGHGVRGDLMSPTVGATMTGGIGVFGTYGLNGDFTTNANASNGIGILGKNFASGGTGLQGEASGTGSTIGLYAKATSSTGTAAVMNNTGGGTILRGQNNGAEKFRVDGSGDVIVNGGDLAAIVQGKGIVLRSTNGTKCFRLTVNDSGTLATAEVTCPN